MHETSLLDKTIRLNFMERDTLLACLKDLIEIKKRSTTTAQTIEEQSLCTQQAKVAQKLYDKIYNQKRKEYLDGF